MLASRMEDQCSVGPQSLQGWDAKVLALAGNQGLRLWARQVRGDTAGGESGPVLGRLQAGQLLHGCEVFLAGALRERGQVQALLRAAGARLLSRPPVPGGAPMGSGLEAEPSRGAALVLWDPDAGGVRPHAPAGIPCLSLQWLYDSAGSFQRLPFERYV